MNNLTIKNGILEQAIQIESPNYNNRPKIDSSVDESDNFNISLLVIHNISLPPREFGGNDVCDFFCNELDCSKDDFYKEIKEVQVSSHLFIRRDGEAIQFVNFNNRAWHAGISNYKGVDNCNDYSIGIELEGCDDIEYTTQQYDSLVKITRQIIKEYPNIKNNITGHENIAKGRKTDPGKSFDWQKYLSSI